MRAAKAHIIALLSVTLVGCGDATTDEEDGARDETSSVGGVETFTIKGEALSLTRSGGSTVQNNELVISKSDQNTQSYVYIFFKVEPSKIPAGMALTSIVLPIDHSKTNQASVTLYLARPMGAITALSKDVIDKNPFFMGDASLTAKSDATEVRIDKSSLMASALSANLPQFTLFYQIAGGDAVGMHFKAPVRLELKRNSCNDAFLQKYPQPSSGSGAVQVVNWGVSRSYEEANSSQRDALSVDLKFNSAGGITIPPPISIKAELVKASSCESIPVTLSYDGYDSEKTYHYKVNTQLSIECDDTVQLRMIITGRQNGLTVQIPVVLDLRQFQCVA